MSKKFVMVFILFCGFSFFVFAEQQQKIPEFIRDGNVITPFYEDNKIIIDWQTTENIDEKVSAVFNASASVNFIKNDQIFLRLDGLINGNEISKLITELISHYHTDHIDKSLVVEILKKRDFLRLIGPIPVREESRNDIFDTLYYNNDDMMNVFHQNYVIDISPNTEPLNLVFNTIGDFIYTSFKINDIAIDLFKYMSPGADPNHDGLIYRISHNGISYLLFGDFDHINGIENLLDAYIANNREKEKIIEEINELDAKMTAIAADAIGVGIDVIKQHFRLYCHRCKRFHVNYFSVVRFIDAASDVKQFRKNYVSNYYEMNLLTDRMNSLPDIILRSDVIKWPHHAHKFKNTDRNNSIIEKINEALQPTFIIWQRHSAQKNNNIEEYIEPFYFNEKFINTDEIIIEFISLFYLQRTGKIIFG